MFGELVRMHRRRLCMTQEDLSDRAGVSVRSIGKWEAGGVAAPRLLTMRILADAFGLEGADREAFLRSAAAPASAAPASAAPAPAALTPAQLPRRPGGFVGRDREIAALDARLAAALRARHSMIAVVSGTAGVGKTALALHWAHGVRDQFPDGQLYVNLRGFDPHGPAVHPAEALRGFLEAFDVAPDRIPAGVDAMCGAYRSLLADRRVLVVLDNAVDAEQVRPLLPGSPACLVVVTSRNQLSGLVATEGAHPVLLDLPSGAEAAGILGRRLGDDRHLAEPAAVEEILARCASLPLALVIVAARAVLNPAVPLTQLAEGLRSSTHDTDLDLFSGTDPVTDVRAVFSWSYRSLTDAAATVFRCLGLHPGPDVTAAAAASLSALPVAVVRRAFAELGEANLVVEHRPGRYVQHDLLRAYARELNLEKERREATRRLLDYYTVNVAAAVRTVEPEKEAEAFPDPAPGTPAETLVDEAQATAWLREEERILVGAVQLAADTVHDAHAVALTAMLRRYLNRNARWDDMITTHTIAIAAAQRTGDGRAEADAHRAIAGPYVSLGLEPRAHLHLRQVVELCTALDYTDGLAMAHRTWSWLYQESDRHSDAIEHDRKALDLFRTLGDRSGEASSLNGLAWSEMQIGAYENALESGRQALDIFVLIGNRSGQAHTSDTLGLAHRHLGDLDAALDCFRRSLELFRLVGDALHEAEVLANLGDALCAAGRPEEARAAWQESVDVFVRLGQPADHVRVKLQKLDG